MAISGHNTINPGDIVLISLFGSMGDLAFLARFAQALSEGGFGVTLIFSHWYLNKSRELLRGLTFKKIGLDRTSPYAYAQKDWNGRARVVAELFDPERRPLAIVADISARHLATPAERHGIPFVVASPMPFVKTREFFPLNSPFPCVNKLGWFNLLRWMWGDAPQRWRNQILQSFRPEPPSQIVNPELRARYRALFAPGKTARWWRGEPAPQVMQFVSADPIIIPRCRDWNDRVYVLGSLPWNTAAWTPSNELQDFLAAGVPPLYVGFGSLTAARFAGEAGAAFLIQLAEAARARRMRVVFSAPLGIQTNPVFGLPGNAFVTPPVSHEWLFPRCRAVVCHGGYGTIYDALLAKKPLVIFPGQSDEFYLAERMRQMGVAPRPNRKFAEFSVRDFSQQLIRLAAAYDAFSSNATKAGDKIAQTDGPRNHLLQMIEIVGRPPSGPAA